MIRRPLRPTWSSTNNPRLIKALGEARDIALEYSSAHRFNSKEYALVHEMTKAIDDLAEHLTGNRRLFWAPSFAYLASGPKTKDE